MKRYLKHLFLVIICPVLLVSCKHDKQNDGDIAFIGGEIINPIGNLVILYKANCIIDTIALDENNRFLYKINDLHPSLYTFKHGREVQMVFLEPNDSIIFRLNTMEFDESLVFTGKGAKKNNYLINRFLENENEKEQKKILRISQYSPEKFQIQLDSLKSIKLEKLKKLNSKHKLSPLFNEIAEANINYNYYTTKEVYPFVYYKHNERITLESLPSNFYNYRSTIDYNNENIKDYFPYYRFLGAHFTNLALSEHFKKSSDNAFNVASLSYTIGKLNLIDSLVTNEDLKNYLLSDTAFEFVNETETYSDYDAITRTFTEKSTNSSHKEHFEKLVLSLKQLKSGRKIPNIKIKDTNSKELSLTHIIKKPTVIYFWDYINKRHFKNSHQKAKELREKHPEMNVIAINVNSDAKDNWKTMLQQYGFMDSPHEYQFINAKEAKQRFAINPINKVILLNRKGEIVNAHTNMFAIYFEEQLAELIKK